MLDSGTQAKNASQESAGTSSNSGMIHPSRVRPPKSARESASRSPVTETANGAPLGQRPEAPRPLSIHSAASARDGIQAPLSVASWRRISNAPERMSKRLG